MAYLRFPLTPVRYPLFLALVILSAGSASRVARAEDAADSPLKEGAWAVEFAINPTFDYGFGFTGSATLAAKRHYSPGRALRFGVNAGFNEDESDGTQGHASFYPPYDPFPEVVEGTVSRHSESHAYSAFLHYIRECPVRDHVAIFGELGPSLRFAQSDSHSEYISGYSTPSLGTYDDHSVTRSVALDVNLGFEWFFTNRLSFGARYGAFVAYQWGSRSSGGSDVALDGTRFSRTEENLDTKGADAGTNRATVTLAAYF